MSEIIVTIFNIITMVCLIFFAGYLSSVLGEQKIGLFKRLVLCVCRWSFKPLYDIKTKRIYLWCYLIIPALIVNVLVVARQFNIGKMYIRVDLGFIASAVLWIALPILFIGVLDKLKKEELKNK
jgi:hypothetical protein